MCRKAALLTAPMWLVFSSVTAATAYVAFNHY